MCRCDNSVKTLVCFAKLYALLFVERTHLPILSNYTYSTLDNHWQMNDICLTSCESTNLKITNFKGDENVKIR